ncbi:MAG: phosphoenolpyruvate--protein phosphotransferase, partial [Tyzzerella sp.]|nr:phosphoenolpyruvate--protein phosphotransferase [Tyzzerella sp.]
QEQLTEQGISWNPDVKIGVMIEIPALAAIADLVAQEVDFASIGTNDLTQYALAVDRVNPDVSSYYQSMHPAMLRLLNFAINEFNKAGKDISVCGEMGGDPVAATALLGMGIKNLSMGYSSVPMIKKLICNIDMEKAREAVICACKSRTAEDVKNILKCVL